MEQEIKDKLTAICAEQIKGDYQWILMDKCLVIGNPDDHCFMTKRIIDAISAVLPSYTLLTGKDFIVFSIQGVLTPLSKPNTEFMDIVLFAVTENLIISGSYKS